MEYELLDPRVDVVFKRIFGSEHNKDVLLAFLNSTFREQGNRHLRRSFTESLFAAGQPWR